MFVQNIERVNYWGRVVILDWIYQLFYCTSFSDTCNFGDILIQIGKYRVSTKICHFSTRFCQFNLFLLRNKFKVPFFKLSMTCDFLNLSHVFFFVTFWHQLLFSIWNMSQNKKSVEKDNFIIKNVCTKYWACKLLRESSHFILNLSTFFCTTFSNACNFCNIIKFRKNRVTT